MLSVTLCGRYQRFCNTEEGLLQYSYCRNLKKEFKIVQHHKNDRFLSNSQLITRKQLWTKLPDRVSNFLKKNYRAYMWLKTSLWNWKEVTASLTKVDLARKILRMEYFCEKYLTWSCCVKNILKKYQKEIIHWREGLRTNAYTLICWSKIYIKAFQWEYPTKLWIAGCKNWSRM
jgi:hypothetical protein